MKHSEQGNRLVTAMVRQETESGTNGKYLLKGTGFLLGMMKMF